MDILMPMALVILTLSLCGNALLFTLYRRERKSPVPTTDAQELLAQICSGPTLLKIQIIDRQDIFLKSPRT